MTTQNVLSKAQLTQFEEQGYLVVRELLDLEADIQPLIDEYSVLLDSLAQKWFADGRLTETYQELPFVKRLTRIIADSSQDYSQYLDISLGQNGVTEQTPLHLGPAIFNLLRSPRLLDAVECFVGSEIYANPVQHVRIKPPERTLPKGFSTSSLVMNTPWHQDVGVLIEEADDSNILTVWLPVTEATIENGCLVVVPGSHKGDLPLHCPKGGTLAIPDEIVGSNSLPLPMQSGDVLFMHSKIAHASLPNISDEIRWSFDLRYNPVGQATGCPWFPGFVARSQANPESE